MTVVTDLFAVVGTLAAGAVLLLMAVVPFLLDLPQRPAPTRSRTWTSRTP